MSDAQRTALASIDGDLAAMGSAVTGSAHANEIFHCMASAFGTELDVMYASQVVWVQPGTWQRC